MPRFPLAIFFFMFAPCLLGIGIGIYWFSIFGLPKNLLWVGIAYSLFSGGIGVWGFIWFIRNWWIPYLRFKRASDDVAIGHKIRKRKKLANRFWKPLNTNLIALERQFDELIDFSTSLAKQEFEEELSERLQETPFAKRLNEVREELYEQRQEEQKRSWTMRGLAEFSDVLRNSEHLDLEILSTVFLRHAVKYMKAQQGVIYLLNIFEEEDQDDLFLELKAHYAISKTDFDKGLTGECFRKRKNFYVQDIKDDYSPIFSGLGAGSPRSLLIFPIALPDKTLGVLEMTSFNHYAPHELDFLETICQNLAVTLEGFYMEAQTKLLLKKTEKANAELRSQEIEIKQNSQELEATQAELNQKLQIIEEETTFLKYILQAIDKTNAMLELDMEGNILEVNDMYLSVMGYTENEIIGKNEQMLLPAEERASDRYTLMWDTLKSGNFISGEYRRIAHDGREVWLNGTYNPIFDTEGNPIRVIQLAQFTTEDKERDLQQNNKIIALSQALLIVEIHLAGTIKSINNNFTQHFGLKRSQVRNIPFANLLQVRQENMQIFEQMWQQVLQGATCLPQTLIYQQAGKLLTKASTYFCPIKNLSGKTDSVMAVLIDVTEVENQQEQLSNLTHTLQENNQKLERLLAEENHLANTLWQIGKAFELDSKYCVAKMNEHMMQKLQYTAQTLSFPFQDLIQTPFPTQVLDKLWQNIHENGFAETVLKYKMPTKGSFWGKTTITIFHHKITQEIRYLGVIQDITEQVIKEVYLRGELVELKLQNNMMEYAHLFKVEEATWQKIPQILEKIESQNFEEVVNKNLVPYLTASWEGEILKVNTLATDILGYAPQDLIGKPLNDLLVFKDDMQEFLFTNKLKTNPDAMSQWLIFNDYRGRGVYANTFIKTQKKEHTLFFVVP
jgi:PAS domain S-box-containing protein